MRALLIFNKNRAKDFRVIVRLQEEELKKRVKALMGASKISEAFRLMIAYAEVETYLPPGEKLAERLDWTFVEDML
ncbi:MAG TPA: hypothetical protein PLH56_01575 [Candidatus Omnitrophota bacterium]|nr:hypothetical protein [Candidatus Omnitrophota bacterium]